MSRPLVSIIVNNYNYGRYLAAAVESALGQAYPEKQVLVVDDGSTDDSRSIIAAYGEQVIPVLKENGGQTSSFNAGFRASRGQVLLYLDADDLLLPGAAERAVAFLSDEQVVKVHWPLWVIDEHGNRTGERKPAAPPPQGRLLDLLQEHGPEYAGWPPTSGNAWRRSFLQQVLPIPEIEREHGVGSASADWHLTMLAPLFGATAAIAEPMSCYRIHGRNDYSCLDFDQRLARDVRMFDHRASVLQEYCRDSNIEVDPARWRENSWAHRLADSIRQIEQLVPPGQPFVLVDDGQLGMTATAARRPIPFIERDGQYYGSPTDDQHAINELTRLCHGGARYLVFAWPAFWWMDHYAGFCRYLREQFRCVEEGDRLIVFELIG